MKHYLFCQITACTANEKETHAASHDTTGTIIKAERRYASSSCVQQSPLSASCPRTVQQPPNPGQGQSLVPESMPSRIRGFPVAAAAHHCKGPVKPLPVRRKLKR